MKAWVLASLASALCYGLNNVLVRLTTGRLSDTLGAFCIQLFSLVVVTAFFLLSKTQGEAMLWSYPGLAAAMGSGISIAFGLYFLLLTFRLGGPVSGAVPVLLSGQIVIAVLSGFLLFREGVSAVKAAGLLCCFLGIWLSSR